MKSAGFALFLSPLLKMPAFAGALNVDDKPIVVAEGADVRIGGVGVGVGERRRHGLYMTDRMHHHTNTIIMTTRQLLRTRTSNGKAHNTRPR